MSWENSEGPQYQETEVIQSGGQEGDKQLGAVEG